MLPDSVLLLPNVAGTQWAAVCLPQLLDHVCLAGFANTMHIGGVTWLPWTYLVAVARGFMLLWRNNMKN
jgi:hypothetical protein